MSRDQDNSATPGTASSVADDAAASPQSMATLRFGIYVLLAAISLGAIVGRILAVDSIDRQALQASLRRDGDPDRVIMRPFLSSNDRSRWATIRSLVEHGTYQIDKIVAEPNWDTIDMVKHDGHGRAAPAPDQGHLYSSKPPLLATLLAGEYWLIHKLTGATLATHPYAIGRFMLVTFNVLPLLLYFVLLASLAERYGKSDWGRLFVFACGASGTFLSTFAVVLNNHLFGAVSALVTFYAVLKIVYDGERRWHWFMLAGLAAAFTVTCELPALSLLGLVGAWLLWTAARPTLLGFLPGVLVVAAAFFGTNYLAHETLAMPYAHRTPENNWYVFQYQRGERVIDSYWTHMQRRNPIDQGEPEKNVYALHVLVGHHGIFSLTPVWLLTLVGLCMSCLARQNQWRAAGGVILLLSVVCLTFYIGLVRTEDRNYGGMTSGFRWVFWFAPLWLIGMLPAADWLARRRVTMVLASVLLGLSVMSASYPIWNPWTHPWLLDYLLSLEAVELGIRQAN